MSHAPKPNRRDLLRSSSAALATTVVGTYVAAGPGRVLRPGGQEMLKIGLIGCGGRGTGAAANALRADPNVKLWALGDTFADHLQRSFDSLSADEELAPKIDVPPERRFVGWDAYKGVIESCDVILLATSPHFRPLHTRVAVEAGKHLFIEKPVATDGPGLRSMMESCRMAKEKGLSVVTGLCYRYHNAKRETMKRIHDGAVGDIVAMQCTYNANGLWHRGRQPEWTEMEYQMRNWIYFHWLSGDHIAEQHIHSLDKIAWAMGDEYPVKATSSGGRIVRNGAEYGNVYDHFNTVFEWENGLRCFSSCRQWNGAATDVSDFVYGTRGKANLQAHRIEAEPWSWRWRSDEPDDMYQNEHDALFASIRKGEPINDGDIMCKSTMMAILGRMAAYTGQTITWEQAWNSQEDLRPVSYAWGEAPAVAVGTPGVTQFV